MSSTSLPLSEVTLRSLSREITITPAGTVTPIGERCNALGYKNVRSALLKGEYSIFAKRAAVQEEAGATLLNVNVVCEGVDEVVALPKAIAAMSKASACPISIDFASTDALVAALKSYGGRPLINSVNGEKAKMDQIFPLMKEFKTAAVALLVDDSSGIPMDAPTRVAIAERILQEAKSYGLGLNDFVFDCVVLGSATEPQSFRVMMETMRLLKERYDCNITLGASNAAFGLPERELFNAHFLSAVVANGCNVPITDVTMSEFKKALHIGDVLRGVDEYGMNYITEFRNSANAETAKVAEAQNAGAV